MLWASWDMSKQLLYPLAAEDNSSARVFEEKLGKAFVEKLGGKCLFGARLAEKPEPATHIPSEECRLFLLMSCIKNSSSGSTC